MPFTIEQLPDEPIVVVTYDPSYFDFREDPHEIVKQLDNIAGSIPERLAIIHDIRDFHMTFSDIVRGMAASFQSKEGSSERMLNTDIYVVGGSDIVKLGIKGAAQVQYGGHQITHCETLEDALQHARARSS